LVDDTVSDDSERPEEIPVSLPVTLRNLAEQMGGSVPELILELRAHMRFNAYSANMELPADVVVEVALRFGIQVRFVRGGR